jgi:hypothetical protein
MCEVVECVWSGHEFCETSEFNKSGEFLDQLSYAVLKEDLAG